MAKTPMYDPLSSEARSPWLAGLTEACAKLSNILDLEVDTFTDLTLSPVDDNYVIYQAGLGNKLWMENPAPVIRKNGIVITPMTANFTINYLGGSVEFDRDSALTKNDVITADATYVIDKSNTLNKILAEINQISLTAGQFKGYFPDVPTMEAALGNGVAGNYVLIGGDENTFYIWNATKKKWEKSYKEPNWSDYYTAVEVDDLLDDKENVIVAHGTTSASDDYYYGGQKTWVNLLDKVLGTTLTGLNTQNAFTVTASDSVVEAIGKLQAQIDEYTHDIFGVGDPTAATVGDIGQDYTNISNGNKFHLIRISGSDYVWEQYQDKLEFDSVPTSKSDNILTSGTIYDELQKKANESDVANIIATDLARKADKAVPSAVGNIAILDATGNLVDSGKGVDDVGRSPTIDTVTLTTSAWAGTSTPYTQVVSINGILSDPTKQIIFVSPHPDAGNVEAIANCNAYCTAQGTNTLTFTAHEEKPSIALTFNVSIQNL